MTKAQELHKLAMEYVDDALQARLGGEAARAMTLFHTAFDLENRALESFLASAMDTEPTRSVLCRSAASLAVECGQIGAARYLINVGLAGSPPKGIRKELEDLRQKILGNPHGKSLLEQRDDPIPFMDTVTSNIMIKAELMETVSNALDSDSLIDSPVLKGFEEDFASYCATEHCVGVSSGTDAIRFALIASGIGSGDTVITVPNGFISTTEAICQAGARPVFVDIDERTYNMDPAKLEAFVETRCSKDSTGNLVEQSSGRRVASVIPVHLYGQMCDMDPILEIAGANNLIVIENACQAHGAEYFSLKTSRWCKAGSMGRAAAFSFNTRKNLSGCGEGGAVTTNDVDIARKIVMLRDHGQVTKYHHDFEGYNGRLDAVQAGFLRIKLKYLSQWTAQRRELARRYCELLSSDGNELILPLEPAWSKGVYHLFVVRVGNRDELVDALSCVGIGTDIHYPVPLHLQKAHVNLGYRAGEFPITERVSEEVVSLPMYPTLTPDQQERIATIVRLTVRGRNFSGDTPTPDRVKSLFGSK